MGFTDSVKMNNNNFPKVEPAEQTAEFAVRKETQYP